MDRRRRGRFGGPSSRPGRILVALACAGLAVTMTACEDGGSRRETRRAEGRVIDEPFADLYVMAGPSPERARLHALDLLNLELERVDLPQRVTALVGRCERRTIVEVRQRRQGTRLRALVDNELSLVGGGVLDDPECVSVRPAEDVDRWVVHDTAPSGPYTLVTKGPRVGLMETPEDVEFLGRTSLPIWSAVWVER